MSIQSVTSAPVQQTSPASSTKQAQSTEQNESSNNSSSSTSKINSTTDTVSISSAAKAAYEESIEAPAENAKEARNGDRLAKAQLARQAAEQAAFQAPQKKVQ